MIALAIVFRTIAKAVSFVVAMKHRVELVRYVELMASLVVNLVYPRSCSACRRPLPRCCNYLCPECASLLPRYDASLHHAEQRLWASPIFRELYTLYVYQEGGVVQKMIHAFKYYGHKHLANFIGSMVKVHLPQLHYKDIDLIIPVPISPDKLRKRRYNQSRLVASQLSKIWHIPMATELLHRYNHTHSQTKLGKLGRMTNVHGNFFASDDLAIQLQGKRVLLVDDVLTTGATLLALCDILEGYGVRSVDVFVISVSNYLPF